MTLEMIAFDADDTLWHGEVYYRDAQSALMEILSPWETPEAIHRISSEIEIRNLALYGYGVKSFMLSMLEAAVQISQGQVDGARVGKILDLGRTMLGAAMELRPYVVETLQTLSAAHPLMVITKGDLLEQTAKVERSGLTHFFSRIEVVSEKTAAAYRGILERERLSPESFLMIGNSVPSDILPVLELGGRAVHIPADTIWVHETVSDFDPSRPGFYALEHIGQLPDLIAHELMD